MVGTFHFFYNPSSISKMAFFGHACRNNRCNFVKTYTLEMMPGERNRDAPGCSTLITSRIGQGHPWKIA